jgi:hypothetical protein
MMEHPNFAQLAWHIKAKLCNLIFLNKIIQQAHFVLYLITKGSIQGNHGITSTEKTKNDVSRTNFNHEGWDGAADAGTSK